MRLVNITWIIISLLLLASVVGAIAACWNLYVTYKRWRIPELIASRSPSVVSMYQGDEGWFISFFLINIALGGFIGAFVIAYEFIMIRGKVLKNRQIFTRGAVQPY